jgi:hypothetical protein
MKLLRVIPLLALCGFLFACSQPASAPKPAAQTAAEVKQPVLYTAQECLKRIDGQAHLWSPDAKPVHLESDLTSESVGKDGKSAIWRAMFVSAGRNAMRSFTCSGSREPSAPAFGVSSGLEMAVPPGAEPFDAFLVKTDSDKAFAISLEHGGKAMLEKNPAGPVTYMVAMKRGETVPYWYVIYGENLKKNSGIGIINATTGAFVRASR